MSDHNTKNNNKDDQEQHQEQQHKHKSRKKNRVYSNYTLVIKVIYEGYKCNIYIR